MRATKSGLLRVVTSGLPSSKGFCILTIMGSKGAWRMSAVKGPGSDRGTQDSDCRPMDDAVK